MSASPRAKIPLARIAAFASASLALFLLLYYPYEPASWPARALMTYCEWVARGCARAIGLFDDSVHFAGETLIAGRFPLQVVLDCTALDVQALYLVAALVVPARARIKLLGAIAGLAFLAVANVARIATLYFVGVYAPNEFDLLHEDVMTLAMMACACLAFAIFSLLAPRMEPVATR